MDMERTERVATYDEVNKIWNEFKKDVEAKQFITKEDSEPVILEISEITNQGKIYVDFN